MSEIDKTINILENIPESISAKITMREILEILNIMYNLNEEDDFEPKEEDFLEALSIRLSIEEGLDDVSHSRLYTTEELKKELKLC